MKQFRHTGPVVSRAPASKRILDSLRAGMTAGMVSRQLNMPLDFVELVMDQAKSSGKLGVLDMASGKCGGASCQPDPESFVCAGCPVLAVSKRHRHGKMQDKQSRDPGAKSKKSRGPLALFASLHASDRTGA